jgi:hypothetical protein
MSGKVTKTAAVEQAKATAARTTDEVVELAKGAAGQIRDSASQVAASVKKNAAAGAKENIAAVADVARQVGDRAAQQADALPEPVRKRGLQAIDALRQRPVLLAVLAVAVVVLLRSIGRRGR